jgi:hypothetical protein
LTFSLKIQLSPGHVWGHGGRNRMVVGYTTTYAITTDVGSSNPDQLKFVSDLPQVGGFLRVLRFPPK